MTKENNPKNHEKTTNGKAVMGADTGVLYNKDNQPTPEAKKAGWAKKRTLESLKKDIFEKLTGLDSIDRGILAIDKKIEDGNTRELLDLLKIITPKDIDIKSDGKEISPTVIVNTNLKKQE